MYLYHQLLLFILYQVYIVFGNSQPEVIVAQGVVKGLYRQTVNKREIASFEGIPYAKPPVGKHRFKEPVPAGSWQGIYNATRQPPMCLQYESFQKEPKLDRISGSEDCLYLNVYTPEVPKAAGKTKLFDVIFYIHGGGFMMGSSGSHGPTSLLDRDIVLVTMNYRLGPFGFLSTEDDVVPGNNGLKDQNLALKWVQQNIVSFGGNPNSVTISGISAGGASCHFHIVSPLSKGLFKGALCQSGVAANPWAMAENSKEKAKILADSLGCPTTDSLLMIKCLRSRPAEHIVSNVPMYWHTYSYPFTPFGPVVEPKGVNSFLPDKPINCLKKKIGSDVPVVFSYGFLEGSVFVNMPNFLEPYLNNLEEYMPHILDYNFTVPVERKPEIYKNIIEHYKLDNTNDTIYNHAEVFGDRMFVADISKIAKVSASIYESPVYVYRFSYRGQKSISNLLGSVNEELDKYATHGSDCIYTVGFSFLTRENENDTQMTEEMQDMWVTFAANGSLGDNWQPVQQQLPKLVFTDIKGPGDFSLIVEDELGEESFWYSLGFDENAESITGIHEEL